MDIKTEARVAQDFIQLIDFVCVSVRISIKLPRELMRQPGIFVGRGLATTKRLQFRSALAAEAPIFAV
jgi:hypothetical protein